MMPVGDWPASQVKASIDGRLIGDCQIELRGRLRAASSVAAIASAMSVHGPSRHSAATQQTRRVEQKRTKADLTEICGYVCSHRLICPTNDFQKSCQAIERKIFLFRLSENYDYPNAIPPRSKGR
jgi:hypothetical protein